MHSDFEERKYGGLSKNDVVSIVRLEVRHIDNLAQALFEEWHDFTPWSSVDKIRSYYSGLNLNQYGVASPCRTICTVCGFVALS